MSESLVVLSDPTLGHVAQVQISLTRLYELYPAHPLCLLLKAFLFDDSVSSDELGKSMVELMRILCARFACEQEEVHEKLEPIVCSALEEAEDISRLVSELDRLCSSHELLARVQPFLWEEGVSEIAFDKLRISSFQTMQEGLRERYLWDKGILSDEAGQDIITGELIKELEAAIRAVEPREPMVIRVKEAQER